jgi:hypothetical protein
MGLFSKRVPDEAIFGATAMVLPLCIDTIFNGGETTTEERMGQLSSVRKALGDLDGRFPGCAQAITMLDAHFPMGALGLSAGSRGRTALTSDQAAQAETLVTAALDGLSSGASGHAALAIGEAMVAKARTYAPIDPGDIRLIAGPNGWEAYVAEEESAGRGDNCALILGLSIDKVNSDTSSVSSDERVQRRKYAAAIAGYWLYRQVCA